MSCIPSTYSHCLLRGCRADSMAQVWQRVTAHSVLKRAGRALDCSRQTVTGPLTCQTLLTYMLALAQRSRRVHGLLAGCSLSSGTTGSIRPVPGPWRCVWCASPSSWSRPPSTPALSTSGLVRPLSLMPSEILSGMQFLQLRPQTILCRIAESLYLIHKADLLAGRPLLLRRDST